MEKDEAGAREPDPEMPGPWAKGLRCGRSHSSYLFAQWGGCSTEGTETYSDCQIIFQSIS